MRHTAAVPLFSMLFLYMLAGPLSLAAAGTVTGRILLQDGTPLTGGMVIVFNKASGPPPAPARYFRPPDLMADLHEDGGFRLNLPPGEYYIGGIRRTDGLGGPPRDGDIFFILSNEKSAARPVRVPAAGMVELGDLAKGAPYRPVVDSTLAVTAIAGTLAYSNGAPAAGLTVSAVLAQPGSPQLFIAPESGKDGKYRITLPMGGIYTLGILNREGRPGAGSQNYSKSLSIDTGKTINNFDFQVQ